MVTWSVGKATASTRLYTLKYYQPEEPTISILERSVEVSFRAIERGFSCFGYWGFQHHPPTLLTQSFQPVNSLPIGPGTTSADLSNIELRNPYAGNTNCGQLLIRTGNKHWESLPPLDIQRTNSQIDSGGSKTNYTS